MKLTKLLTGAAVAALLTGAANAQLITVGNYDGTAAGAAQNEYGPSTVFASQLDLADAISTANLEFQLDLSSATGAAATALAGLAATDDFSVVITFTGAEFDSGINNTSFVGAGGTCVLALTAGGSAGSSTATFTTTAGTDPGDCIDAATDVEFAFPINLTAQEANFSILVEDADDGTDIYTETYDAVSATLADEGFARTANGVTIAVAPANMTVAVGTNGVPFDNAVITSVGTLTPTNVAGVVGDFDTGTTGVPLDFDLSDYASTGSLAVTVPAPTSFIDGTAPVTAGVRLTTVGTPSTVSAGGGSASFTVGATGAIVPGDLDDGDVITINMDPDADDSGTSIAAQQISYELTLNANAATGFSGLSSSGNLGQVLQAGSTTLAPFTWVGDSTAVTRNVFRCIDVDAGASVFATTSDAADGSDGVYTLSPANSVSAGGELIITNADLAPAGNFDRANVAFTFTPDAGTAATCQRLLVGNNGTLSELD